METRFKKMIQGAVRHKCQNVSSALKKQSMKEDILPPTYAARPGLGAGWGRRRLTARPHLEQLSSGHGVPVELPPEAAQEGAIAMDAASPETGRPVPQCIGWR